jgi:hypothetical protein
MPNEDCDDPDCDACHFARVEGVPHCERRCINSGRRVQAPALAAPVVYEDDGEVVLVAMTKLDALQVGQTLRTQSRDRRTPLGVRDQLSRVGTQMTSTALLALSGGRR